MIEREAGDLRSKTPINFVIRDTAGLYLDLNSLYVEIEVQLTDPNFARTAAIVHEDTKPFFINNFGQSIWSVIKVFINDVCVENNYHNTQLCNLRQLLTTSNQDAADAGEIQGCFPIETVAAEVVNDTLAKDDIKQRIAFTKRNKVKLIAPLSLNISTCQKYLVVRFVLNCIPAMPRWL